MKNCIPPQDGSGPNDTFHVIMPNKYSGRCRFGKVGIEKKLKNVSNYSRSQFSREDLESLKASVEAEKTELVNMRKELEEDYARNKAELQEDHAKKMRELETMKEKMTEDIITKLLSKFPIEIVRTYLS